VAARPSSVSRSDILFDADSLSIEQLEKDLDVALAALREIDMRERLSEDRARSLADIARTALERCGQ
jgi:hypothetical protein